VQAQVLQGEGLMLVQVQVQVQVWQKEGQVVVGKRKMRGQDHNRYPIYPTTHPLSPNKTRSLLLINVSINLDSWEQISILSDDITAVVIRGTESDLLLYNIYNNRDNNTSLNALTLVHNTVSTIPSMKLRHIIWLSDFNRHHPV
jgi:hypothetical protein